MTPLPTNTLVMSELSGSGRPVKNELEATCLRVGIFALTVYNETVVNVDVIMTMSFHIIYLSLTTNVKKDVVKYVTVYLIFKVISSQGLGLCPV